MRYLLLLCLLFLCFSCSPNDDDSGNNQIGNIDNTGDNDPPNDDPDPVDDPDSQNAYELLFVGNSLTLTNDLPQLVKDRAEQLGITIGVTTEANPGFGLEDHWNSGIIQGQINSGFYDYVIIQQGPSSQPYGRATLIGYGELIKELCDGVNTELAYFMVWPSLEYYYTFPGVILNYSDAAEMNNAILCPVGSHWKAYIENTEDYSYYGPDGFHPSLLGSQVAAQIIITSLGLQ
ncbi:MAG: SGNH/GDSL hydrolase family protein [Bacteroidia bacterium]|nr:SGNH/GDSL hydrolase family protein [Bacteroidia bacterium]